MARRVAVIGAGAAGLCAARHLSARPDQFVPTVYEQTDRVGGTWVYTDRVGTDEHGLPVHSSMYKNLRTNLPKEVMAFPDFPFDSSLPSFVTHQEVLKYLEDYTDHFQLRKHIQFLTKVDTVKPVTGAGQTLWEVTVSSVEEPEKITTQQFDAVMVCNGHFSEPYIPEIPQASYFRGISLHSHDYRSPTPFTGMDVVVVGAGNSGLDIALEVSKVARRVVLSHDKELVVSKLPRNLTQSTGIKSFRSPRTVEFKNGEELNADAVIYCTGYSYSFPFLTRECGVCVERGRVSPLYKHVVHTTHTTLSFIGVCNKICPCPQFHLQVQFAMAVLDRSLVLPSKEEMDKEVERDYSERLESGMAPHHAHVLGNKQWEYHVELARLAGCQPLSKALHSLHASVLSERSTDLCGFRNSNYSITGPDTWCKESVLIEQD
ncbi:uncharacterized protein LOC144880836 isoform X1 [Branchiostoma floridae x Branchiostoma japonicum]